MGLFSRIFSGPSFSRGYYCDPRFKKTGEWDFLRYRAFRGVTLWDCLYPESKMFAACLLNRVGNDLPYQIMYLGTLEHEFIHAYLDCGGLFIDARGITDDWDLFSEAFIGRGKKLNYNNYALWDVHPSFLFDDIGRLNPAVDEWVGDGLGFYIV